MPHFKCTGLSAGNYKSKFNAKSSLNIYGGGTANSSLKIRGHIGHVT